MKALKKIAEDLASKVELKKIEKSLMPKIYDL